MGRRLFAERDFQVNGRVLPYDQFRLFIDRPEGFHINEEHYAKLIANGEAWLEKEIPSLYASEYMMFKRNGNRSVYEGKYFPRRSALLDLATAEYIERRGRFTDKMIDVLWLILEETSWVIPAHNPGKPGVDTCLPYAFRDDPDYIDLFAATTAASLSFAYYLCHDIWDGVTTLIGERVLYELNRRIVKPFLDDRCVWDKCWWSGIRGNTVNNWCPWIVSNILTVAALTVKDTTTRTVMVRKALPMLDAFTSVYFDDGGCDEGPSYWNAAGGALYNACCVLYDMTDGYIDIFKDPLMKNMGEYEVKAIIHGNRVLNFADSPAKLNPKPILLYQWGVASDSEMMKNYGLWKLDGGLTDSSVDTSMCYRAYKFLTEERHEKAEFHAPERFFLDGVVIAGTRECAQTDKGLYLAFKGGHNAESHNHNDVGTLVVFADGNPIFIDAGSGTYTRRTFSPERYTIWAMRSDYHNCATFNGVPEEAGKQFCSCDSVYDEATGKLTLNLKNAYPEAAGISSYHRSAVLQEGVITVEDDVHLNAPGSVMFSFLLVRKPEQITDHSFTLFGRTVSFDPSLTCRVETLDCSWPETERLPRNWDVENLWRVTLTSGKPVKDKTYVLTVR